MAARRKSLRSEQEDLRRRIDRAELAKLRDNISRAKALRSRRMKTVRAATKSARADLARKTAKFRTKWREWVTREVVRMRVDHAKRYRKAAAQARRISTANVSKAEAELDARRALTRALKRTADWRRDQLKSGHPTTFRKAESDDEVRRNLPPELQLAWKQLRSKVRTRFPGKSRTEAFVEWVEANPEELADVLATRQEQRGRADFDELQRREQAAHEQELLEAVPF